MTATTCDDCGRWLKRPPILYDGKTLGPKCAVKRGIKPERQIPIKWHKPSGATPSAFRRPPGANARQMGRGVGSHPTRTRYPTPPPAMDGEIPLWTDETESEEP